MKKIKIKEEIVLEVGGTKQYLNILSNNLNNPVILFLHGGPGISERKTFEKFCSNLIEDFTMVNHDQRISGKTFSFFNSPKKINIEQFIKDEIEIIDFLRKKFKKTKIYIIGHCWGSILGLYLVQMVPEKLEKFIGVGQIIDMALTEEIAYKNTLKEAIKTNDKKAIYKLTKIGRPKNGLYKQTKDVKTRYYYSIKYGGQFHRFNLKTLRSLLCYCSPKVFLETFNGLNINLKYIWEEISKVNFFELEKKLKVAVYFFVGKYDGIAPPMIVEKYYNMINCPEKDIVYFHNSAHMVFTEEPNRFNEMVIEKFKR